MVLAGSSATIQTSVITGNTSTDGGGVFADVNTQLTVTDSNISNNVSRPFSTPFGPTGGGGGGGRDLHTLKID
jgi:hypothetical protein